MSQTGLKGPGASHREGDKRLSQTGKIIEHLPGKAAEVHQSCNKQDTR
jgi:hypothetical protein